MPVMFNADEVFEMAKQIERNGAAFYRKAAANLAGSKDLLLELAKEEDKHLAKFTEMQKELSAREKESAAFDPDDEGALYLQAMAGGHVFDTRKDPSAMLTGKESLAQIIGIAIGLEKDSIVFYVGLQDLVSKRMGSDKVESIIAEEMKHIRLLNDKLASL